MSEKYQNKITGADIEQYNPNFSYTTGNMFPMNTKVFEKLMSNADSFAYNTSGEYEPDGSDTPRTDEPQAKISEKSLKLLHNKLDNIQYYEMNDYTIGYIAKLNSYNVIPSFSFDTQAKSKEQR